MKRDKQKDKVVVAHFKFLDDALRAIAKLRDEGADYDVYSAFPNHDLEDEIYKYKKRSPVRRFTLLGGLTGVSGAFLMTIWKSIDYQMRVSAKPLISIPSFVVIGFECTILLGAIFTLLSMFFFSGIPNFRKFSGYKPNFSEGTFGITVFSDVGSAESLKSQLSGFGAELVEVENA